MAIKPICSKCKEELVGFGGLLFSPPDDVGDVKKYHLCKKCFDSIHKSLDSENNIFA